MASAQKPTGTRRRTTTRAKKPATIDLKATEVKSETDDATKPAQSKSAANVKTESKSEPKTENKQFGRDAAKSTAADKTTTAKTEAAKSTPKPTADPKTAKDKQSSLSPTKSSGGGMRSGLMGGVLGSVLTVAGLGVVGQMDSAPNLPLIGSLYEKGSGGTETDVGALVSRLEALEGVGGVDLGSIEDRIAKLETAPQVDLSSIESEISTLKGSINSITNAVSSGGEASTSEVSAALATIATRLDAVEQNATSEPADNSVVLQKIAELETALTDLSQTGEVDLTQIEGQLAEVQSSVSSLSETVESNAASVAALNEQSSTLKDTVASVKQSEKVARSVAVNALGAALENDDPINLALSSVKSLVGETSETKRLDELSENGIATRKTLLAELAALTNSVQNPRTDTSNGSMSDRFWGGLSNLVTFRTSGPLEGDSPVAILSRVKANLEQEDLSALLLEWQKLPQEIKTSGAGFEANVKSRLEAFSIYEKLSNLLAETAG